MAFFKGITDTLSSILPSIEITALTNDQFDQYKKQFAGIEKTILQVSKREEEYDITVLRYKLCTCN